MKKEKMVFHHKDGMVEGIYLDHGNGSPLVIIVNGHNGFYNYGMFPYIQEKLFENGISSYSFNFSHGGITGEADHFDDLEKYERNCIRLETEDLICILRNLNKDLKGHTKIFLFAHSMGSVPAIFGAKKAQTEKIKIDGIILAAPVKTLNFWPADVLTEWASAGVYYKRNNRTKQDLPQGFELLQEVLKSETVWNVEQAISELPIPVLIIHGGMDEAVPSEHGESLFARIRNKPGARLVIIPGATHTFNTRHPFENSSEELEELIKICVERIQNG